MVALDLGSGCGVLALEAAAAGADSVVACEVHPKLCTVARRNAANNGLASKVGAAARAFLARRPRASAACTARHAQNCVSQQVGSARACPDAGTRVRAAHQMLAVSCGHSNNKLPPLMLPRPVPVHRLRWCRVTSPA